MTLPIEIDGLSKIYRGKRGRRVVALSGLSLTVQAGEIVGFLGPNGAGKSTTIKALVGLLRPTAGVVRLFGQSVTEPDARRQIGYLPENPALYDFLTPREYLALVGNTFGMARAELTAAMDEVLALLELQNAAHRPIRGFSKGMVQRLGIAQTLLHSPDLYILDEPMSGLDPLGRALVKRIMLDIRSRGGTIFFSTHVTSDVEEICDRVAVVVGGKLRALQGIEELRREGIAGYRIQVSPAVLSAEERQAGRMLADGHCEVFVPCAMFTAFVARVAAQGETVRSVEAQRRSLEHYFLSLVESSKA